MAGIGPKEAARRALREREALDPPDVAKIETATTEPAKPAFDRIAYQRTYMRRWRANRKAPHV
jgi:hypothetical protein